MSAELKLNVNVTIGIFDAKTLALLDTIAQHNLATTAGKNLIRDLLYGDVVNGLTHLAVGTGSTAAAVTQTTLVTEVFRDTLTAKIKNSGGLTATYFLATGSANGNTLTEAGLFNAASVGSMYARVVLASPIVKTASIAATFTWDLSWT